MIQGERPGEPGEGSAAFSAYVSWPRYLSLGKNVEAAEPNHTPGFTLTTQS